MRYKIDIYIDDERRNLMWLTISTTIFLWIRTVLLFFHISVTFLYDLRVCFGLHAFVRGPIMQCLTAYADAWLFCPSLCAPYVLSIPSMSIFVENVDYYYNSIVVPAAVKWASERKRQPPQPTTATKCGCRECVRMSASRAAAVLHQQLFSMRVDWSSPAHWQWPTADVTSANKSVVQLLGTLLTTSPPARTWRASTDFWVKLHLPAPST